MGKVKDKLQELGELFVELKFKTETWGGAIDAMEQILSPEEFDFFLENIDAIQDMLGFNVDLNDVNDIDNWDKDGNMTIDYDLDYNNDPDENIYPTNEARGVKGDVLRPYGGRKARAGMGYGKGNRANYNPEDEIDTEEEILRQKSLMQDVKDNQRGPITSKIIDDEEVFDVDDDYDQYELGPGDGGMATFMRNNRTDESLLMPSINEYWDDDERENQRYLDADENSRRRFKEREQTYDIFLMEDERDFVRSQKGLYVKVGKMYMPALYHTPSIGRTDGKLYRKNKRTGGYFPVKG